MVNNKVYKNQANAASLQDLLEQLDKSMHSHLANIFSDTDFLLIVD